MRTITIVLMTTVHMLFSQSFWERTEPYSAILNDLYFPGGDTVYGTLNSGFTRSTNNGTTWSSHVIVNYVQDMAVAPNGHIFLAQNQQKMSRSTNKGNSFTIIGMGINEPSCSAVLATPAGTLLAGTSRGIYRSTNNGDVWTKVAGPEQLGADTTISGFARHGTTLFAVTNSNQTYPEKSYLLTSADDGVTWTKGSSSLDSVAVYKIITLPNGMVIARTNNAVRATTNGGNSWSAIGFYNEYIYDIAVGPAGELYTSLVNVDTTAIFKTTNNGGTWNAIQTPFAKGGPLAVNAAGYIFTGRDQMYRTTDHGVSWKALPVSYPNVTIFKESPKKELFVTAGGSAYQGLYRSADGGVTWKPVNTGVGGIPILGFYGDTLLVGDNYYPAKIYRSEDNGVTFKAMAGISVLSGYVNALIGTSYQSIIAGTSTGIFRSVDQGKVWMKVSNTPASFLHQMPNGTLYAHRSFSGSGVFRSTDSGSTWQELKNGMGNTIIHNLIAAPNGDLYSSADAGLFRSTDAGDNWIRIDTQKVNKPYGIFAAVNTDGKLFFGGAKSGINAQVYQSSDNGSTWSQITNNIAAIDNQATLRSLFVASNGMVFAGTSSGLFRSTAKTTAVLSIPSTAPRSIEVDQNFPNPFNPSTTIRFTLHKAGATTVTIYDLLGREMEELLNAPLESGMHEVRFNAVRYSSGIYFYTIRTGGNAATKKMTLLR